MAAMRALTALRPLAARRVLGSSSPLAMQIRGMCDAPATEEEPERPTIAEARSMATHPSEMSNDVILAMCAAGNLDACRERLTRNVMAVDGIEWGEADKVVDQIAEVSRPAPGDDEAAGFGRTVCSRPPRFPPPRFKYHLNLPQPKTAFPCGREPAISTSKQGMLRKAAVVVASGLPAPARNLLNNDHCANPLYTAPVRNIGRPFPFLFFVRTRSRCLLLSPPGLGGLGLSLWLRLWLWLCLCLCSTTTRV